MYNGYIGPFYLGATADCGQTSMHLGRWQGGILHGSRDGPFSLLLAVEGQDADPAQLYHVHPQQPAPQNANGHL